MYCCLLASNLLETQQQRRYTIAIYSTSNETNTMNFNTAPIISLSEAARVWIHEEEKWIWLSIQLLQVRREKWSLISTQESLFLSPSEIVVSIVVVVIYYYYYYKSQIVAIFAPKFHIEYCVIILCFTTYIR